MSVAIVAAAAIVAVVQAALLVALIAGQRSDAHIIDISAMQRTRSQRIAFLATAAYTNTADAGWRNEMEETIRGLLSVREEMKNDPWLSSGVRDARGKTPLERLSDPYIDAARRLEADPHDRAAYLRIRRDRLALYAAYDETVRVRAAKLLRRRDDLLATIVASVAIQLCVILGSWLGWTRPAERRIRTLLADVTLQREQSRSLFDQNPDSIGVYDADGKLVRANRARVELFGLEEEEQVGRHVSSFAPPDYKAQVVAAFEGALEGTATLLELNAQTADGTVQTQTTVFPNVVEGNLKGAVFVSRDVTELRAAQRRYAEQAQRIADLYSVISDGEAGAREQISRALAFTAQHLGYRWGSAIEIIDDTAIVVAVYGDAPATVVGHREPLAGSRAGFVASRGGLWVVDDFRSSPFPSIVPDAEAWGSVAAMPICADGQVFGTFGVADPLERRTPLSKSDRQFMELVGAMLGTVIERDRRERRLNSLAFYDTLTGLPNRANFFESVRARLEEASRTNASFAIHYIDLDDFKIINDTFGHGAGDDVLKIVSARLANIVRDGDVAGRLAGDEFVVMQRDAVSAAALASRIVDVLSEPFVLRGERRTLGASVGAATYPGDGTTIDALLAAADRALYAAKRIGKNRCVMAAGIPVTHERRNRVR